MVASMVEKNYSTYDGRTESQLSFPKVGKVYKNVAFVSGFRMGKGRVLKAEVSIPNTEFRKFFLILNGDLTPGKYTVEIVEQAEAKKGELPRFVCKILQDEK